MSGKTKIRIMPEDLANKIAAGEVVERPASVVKELIENSLDAEATNITIDIQAGGKRLVRVSDNGLGMSHDDALLAFERHATSKIKCLQDLDEINTFGFRGEALPSIASVSRLHLISLLREEMVGVSINVEGGIIKKVTSIGCPTGTSIEVRDLFYNTPARLKFLRTELRELQQIGRIITQQALANYHVNFRFVNSRRTVIDAPSVSHLDQRLAALFGVTLASKLIPIDLKRKDMVISGFVSNAEFSKSDRENQFLFINKRSVRNPIISKVNVEIYSNIFPKGRHPAIFIFLDLDPKNVDVNVHPTKAEVRFRQPQDIIELVKEGLRKAWIRTQAIYPTQSFLDDEEHSPVPVSLHRKEKDRSPVANGSRKLAENHALSETPSKTDRMNMTPNTTKTPASDAPLGVFHRPPEIKGLSPQLPLEALKQYRILGQLRNSFILLEIERGLLLVDQHCAHERVLYERFMKSTREGKIKSQHLLFPEKLELPLSQAIIIEKKLHYFEGLGFQIEPFGRNTFLIKAVPALLGDKDCTNLVLDLAEVVSQEHSLGREDSLMEEIARRVACHGAVKSHQNLQLDEIRALIENLETTQYPFTCPHGRPVTLLLDLAEIKKRFLR